MKILVTGVAGFIGMHVSLRLLNDGHEVIGVDNLNKYYDVNLKQSRLNKVLEFKNFEFIAIDVENKEEIEKLFTKYKPERVIHLAAQAGVRYSLENPYSYINTNISGFINILEGCRHTNVDHLVYASSSSVYGGNTSVPFSEQQNVDHPVSLYAATKKSNELMAHCYSHLYGLPTTGLRFFTVYGPWGRPDMALFLFTNAILNQEPIKVFNSGKMTRDFTFIDDIVEGIVRILGKVATINENYDSNYPDPATSNVPYRIFNIGNNNPVSLLDYIEQIEKSLNMAAKKIYLPLQPGDVVSTYSSSDNLEKWINFKPNTSLSFGVESFVNWYLGYYNSQK